MRVTLALIVLLIVETDCKSNPTQADVNKAALSYSIEKIMSHQNPPKLECKTRRLLILQMKTTSFEGIGSLLKQILLGIAIAIHSNRILIWGHSEPYLFEHTKEIWGSSFNDRLLINNISLNCRDNADAYSGAYACFFEPLSTCDLKDITQNEYVEFSKNGYNDTSRVIIGEIARKGLALYIPPQMWMDDILHVLTSKQPKTSKKLLKSLVHNKNHLWVSVVASYAFRLKESVQATFQSRLDNLLNKHKSDSPDNSRNPSEQINQRPTKRLADKMPVIWGVHVRHGDLRAMPHVYKYKRVFDFLHYFHAARDLSHEIKKSPAFLYLATDSAQADDVPELFSLFNSYSSSLHDQYCTGHEAHGQSKIVAERHAQMSYFYLNYFCPYPRDLMSLHAHWYKKKIPQIVILTNSSRFRTPHGSHTVAANGGCLKDHYLYNSKGMKCSLELEAILQYQDPSYIATPRSYRLMQVLIESIEDLFILSRCQALIAQGSSYFSTSASVLVWSNNILSKAYKQFNPLQCVLFLDQSAIEEGVVPTSHLHGMNLLNTTYGLPDDPEEGRKRWEVHHNLFVSGLKQFEDNFGPNKNSIQNPWIDSNRMVMKNSLPYIPEHIFYQEVSSWNQSSYQPKWPGHCSYIPHKQFKIKEMIDFLRVLLNMAREHRNYQHYYQSHICSQVGIEIASYFVQKKNFTLLWGIYSELIHHNDHLTVDPVDLSVYTAILSSSEILNAAKNDNGRKGTHMTSLRGVDVTNLASIEANLNQSYVLLTDLLAAQSLYRSVNNIQDCTSGRYFPLWSKALSTVCCDAFPSPNMSSEDQTNHNQIKNNSITYIKATDMTQYISQFSLLPKSYRVSVFIESVDISSPVQIFAMNDVSYNKLIAFLNDLRLRKLYVHNCDLIEDGNSKIVAVPLGVDLHSTATDAVGSISERVICEQQYALYSNHFHPHTMLWTEKVATTLVIPFKCDHVSRPEEVSFCSHFSSFKDKKRDTVNLTNVLFLSNTANRSEVRNILSQYLFIVVPTEKSLDSYLVWEALILKSIPIVLTSTLDHLYKEYPIAIIDSWESIFVSSKLLSLKTAIESKFDYNPFSSDVDRRLSLDYWVDLVRVDSTGV